jgi:hypothetical protein
VANAKLHLQLQGDAILPVLGMIGGYIHRMKSMCSLAMAGLPDLPWDFPRQNSRNFQSLHRITVSGFTRISSDLQSRQIFETKDQNSLSLFLNIGFFDLRLSTVSCCRSTRIRSPATRLNHAQMTRLRDCAAMITSQIFMLEAWSPESRKSNKINLDGVFAEHGFPSREEVPADGS